MRKLLCFSLCFVLVLSLFAGCAQSETGYVPTGDALEDENADISVTEAVISGEQELTLVYYPNRSLHPYECTDYTNRTILSLIYQSLFVVDDEYNVSPLLCERYAVSDDMMTYTFYLQDATFSDGTALTAQHVVESYEQAMDSDVYEGRFHHVSEVYASYDGGVTFQLDTPYENFPILLDVPIIKVLPKEDTQTGNDTADDGDGNTDPAATEPEEEEDAQPLGTGPYYLEDTASGKRLRRRTNWWCSPKMAVTASSITLVEAESTIQVRDAFEFEDVGLVCADPGSDTYADYRCDYELWDIDSGIFLYLGFNMASGEENEDTEDSIFTDSALRSAVTYAIDREQIAADHYRGYGIPATLPASPNSPYYDKTLAENYVYNSELFAQAVTKAGVQGWQVDFLVNANDTMCLKVAKDIAAMLEAGGLVVNLIQWSSGNYDSAIAARNYDMYLAQTKLSANMDLSPYFYIYGSLSYGALDNDAAYALCLESLENEGNYYNLHKLVMDNGYLCPILFRSYAVYATRGLLSGLSPARDNVFYYDLGTSIYDIQVPMDEADSDE